MKEANCVTLHRQEVQKRLEKPINFNVLFALLVKIETPSIFVSHLSLTLHTKQIHAFPSCRACFASSSCRSWIDILSSYKMILFQTDWDKKINVSIAYKIREIKVIRRKDQRAEAIVFKLTWTIHQTTCNFVILVVNNDNVLFDWICWPTPTSLSSGIRGGWVASSLLMLSTFCCRQTTWRELAYGSLFYKLSQPMQELWAKVAWIQNSL